VPVYDIPRNQAVGRRELVVGEGHFVAEGIFAPEVVDHCRARGMLSDAICVRQNRIVTFWRGLTRDLRERRSARWYCRAEACS
jgi:uridine kinase